jgi:hypothetical protein
MWKTAPTVDPTIADPVSHALREYFVWADGLADRFGTAYRDASVAPFILAPLTVILAVTAQVMLAREQVDTAIQVLVTFGLLALNWVLYMLMAHRHWHERWIDYRSLAEELRHLAFLWPLGRPLRSIPLPSEAESEAPQFAWVAWYARAVARQAALFPCVFTPERLNACRSMLVEHFMRPQCHYHGRARDRFLVVQERLHRVALWLFFGMLLLAAADVVLAFGAPPPVAGTPLSSGFGWKVFAAALALVIPYIATSTHGFLSQGDFWNLSRRSHRMCQQLEPLMTRVLATPPTLEALGTCAEDAADIMRDEVLNWRVFVRLKPPALS